MITKGAQNFERKKKLASVIGLLLNFLLAAAKIAAGLVFGLVSVIADGVNNLSDGGSCLIALVSYRIAAKPADNDHPYGHQRAEYIASMCIAFLVVALGVELFRESIDRILSPSETDAGLVVFLVLGISVLFKLVMCLYYRRVAKLSGSDVLRAASLDSACDTLSTLATLLGALLCRYGLNADGWVGLAVALFILWQGLRILLDACSKLLGQAPSLELIASIKKEILTHDGILGLHDLKIYPFGPHKIFATVHIETDASAPAIASHELLDLIERDIKQKFDIEITAHNDPVALDDAEAEELKEKIYAAIEGMVEGMDLHDFRMVHGARNTVVFEVGIPFSCEKSDREIYEDVCRAVKVFGDFDTVITVERE